MLIIRRIIYIFVTKRRAEQRSRENPILLTTTTMYDDNRKHWVLHVYVSETFGNVPTVHMKNHDEIFAALTITMHLPSCCMF